MLVSLTGSGEPELRCVMFSLDHFSEIMKPYVLAQSFGPPIVNPAEAHCCTRKTWIAKGSLDSNRMRDFYLKKFNATDSSFQRKLRRFTTAKLVNPVSFTLCKSLDP